LQNNKKTNNINTAGKKVIYKIVESQEGFKALTAYFMQNLYWFFKAFNFGICLVFS